MEVLLDDAYWPCFSTTRARSLHAQWEHVGEGFIKELDFGRVWLRLNDADEGDKDEIVAEYKGDAKKFLDQTLVSFPVFVLVPSLILEKWSLNMCLSLGWACPLHFD